MAPGASRFWFYALFSRYYEPSWPIFEKEMAEEEEAPADLREFRIQLDHRHHEKEEEEDQTKHHEKEEEEVIRTKRRRKKKRRAKTTQKRLRLGLRAQLRVPFFFEEFFVING